MILTFLMHREPTRDGAGWWATCEDLPGWIAAANDRDKVEDMCVEATHDLLRAFGYDTRSYTVQFHDAEEYPL